MPIPILEPSPEWADYYVNETTGEVTIFYSTDGEPEDAPATNLICINLKVDGGRDTRRLLGADNYLFLVIENAWVRSSDRNVQTRIDSGVEFSARLIGLDTTDSLFRLAIHVAETDPNFPNALDDLSFSRDQLARWRTQVELERQALTDLRQANLDMPPQADNPTPPGNRLPPVGDPDDFTGDP